MQATRNKRSKKQKSPFNTSTKTKDNVLFFMVFFVGTLALAAACFGFFILAGILALAMITNTVLYAIHVKKNIGVIKLSISGGVS